MICKSCEKETDEGMFCEHCGASLTENEADATDNKVTEPTNEEQETDKQPAETDPIEELLQEDEAAATEDAEEISSDPEPDTPEEPNESVEMLKNEGARLWEFLITLIKKPADAKKMGEDHFISGIAIAFFLALLISINQFIHAKSILLGSTSFFDYFIIPFLKYLLLFGLLGIIIFAASKVAQQELSIKETYAKYGAYLVPFALLFAAGLILSLIKLWLIYSITTLFSLAGIVLLIPIFILSEQKVKGFDLIYTTIVVTLVSFVIFGYLIGKTLLTPFIGILFS